MRNLSNLSPPRLNALQYNNIVKRLDEAGLLEALACARKFSVRLRREEIGIRL